MITGIMPTLGSVLKYALPIAETVLPAVINKVINSDTDNFEPSYIPPQTPVVCNENTGVGLVSDGAVVDAKCDDKKVQINLNMNVFVINGVEDFEKLKDMSFSKSYEF